MLQFTLKRLLVSMALIAGGCAALAASLAGNSWDQRFPFFIALFGAGIGSFYKRPILGVVAGAILGFVLPIVVVNAMFFLSPWTHWWPFPDGP